MAYSVGAGELKVKSLESWKIWGIFR